VKRILVGLTLLLLFALGTFSEERAGAWLDEILMVPISDGSTAATMIRENEIHLHAAPLTDPKLLEMALGRSEFKDPPRSYGGYVELTFNPYPADPAVMPKEFKNGMLNPFAVPAIREAMNWLIDREYIASEIYHGLAIPRYFAISPVFRDYARLADVAWTLEVKYAHDPERAKEIIFAEMEKLGAELVDGKWYYKGKPVTIIFLIRVEDERKQIGDYVATLLEGLGFTVARKYGRSRELVPIWFYSDPAEGQWNIYTGGWLTTTLSRDEADNFGFFYTPRGLASPLWQAYEPAPEFDEVCGRLARREFNTIMERDEFMAKALELSLKDSVRVWIVQESSYFMMRRELEVPVDLASGIAGFWGWAHALHRVDEEGYPISGGSAKVGVGELRAAPWNPVAGSRFPYDMMLMNAIGERAVMMDPWNGLPRPYYVESADVYVAKPPIPVVTFDWVNVYSMPKIKVPEDAWIDWDASKQRFIFVGERYPEGLTARTKTVVYYRPGIFSCQLHDGSSISLADFLMEFILFFDRAKVESPIFDEAHVDTSESFRERFKGFKILSEDPLIIEYYSDSVYLDAEYYVLEATEHFDMFYDSGPGPWHTIAIGLLAETDYRLAFSADKANKLGVEWMDYAGGPSLDILAGYLDMALHEAFIPYETTLGQWITREDAVARYYNLKEWFEETGHFLVGNGPYLLQSLHSSPIAPALLWVGRAALWIGRNVLVPALAGVVATFATSLAKKPVPEVEIEGPQEIKIGGYADFDVEVKRAGTDKPYPTEDIEEVKYVITGPRRETIAKGDAEFKEIKVNGLWKRWEVFLTPETTARFEAGRTYSLKVVVISKRITVVASETKTFIATPQKSSSFSKTSGQRH